MLNEEDKFMLKKKEIANVFNAYFDSVTDSFDLLSWFNQSDINNIDITKNIVKWLQNHPRLIQIKEIVRNQAKFYFQPSRVHSLREVMVGSSSNKVTAGEIPTKVL